MAKHKKHRLGKPHGLNLAETKKRAKETFDRLVKAASDAKFKRYKNRLLRMCADAAMMAANDVFHMGPARCEAFRQAMVGYVNEMAGMIVQDAQDDPEFIYTKAKVDERLKQICGEEFQPWEVRYKDETD